MAPFFQWGPHVLLMLYLYLLPHCLLMTASELDIIDPDPPELICSEGLRNCNLSQAHFTIPLSDFDLVNVIQMEINVSLCSSAMQDYKPCLQIKITLNEVDQQGELKQSGDDRDEDSKKSNNKASVRVCISCPAAVGFCKAVHFKLNSNQSSRPSSHELLWTVKKGLDFGNDVVVSAYSKETSIVQNIQIPDIEEVCSSEQRTKVKRCHVPRLRLVSVKESYVIRLRLEDTDSKQKELCLQMVWDGFSEKSHEWPKGKSEMSVRQDFVAPCLCFQIWWKGEEERGKYCPFQREAPEKQLESVSVTVEEIKMRDGGTGLRWNVTSPCRLTAEAVLCEKNVAGDQCEEVKGSGQELPANWIASGSRHWLSGEFTVSPHPRICVQMKIKGMEGLMEPQCPFATSRVRWILPFLLGLLLICLAALGSYFIQGVLKGYVWRWLKEEDVKGALGGGHVVLLYPSDDDDQSLPGLLCHLGSSLQALGFTVSLDLWSQAELGILGPVPWLHSRLDQLQRQGGKVVLVLTQVTWTRAEEWGARSCERNNPTEKSGGVEEGTGGSSPASAPRVDVFGASLSCILADYLQGRAGERFMLVQFESLPPEPPGGYRPLPQLFRGLHVYSLPSQSLGFLTELAGTLLTSSASARRKRAGGLRMASRTLAQRLSGCTVGTNILQIAEGVSQGCVDVGQKDSGETVPLQVCLITPPSSPDINPKVSEVESSIFL